MSGPVRSHRVDDGFAVGNPVGNGPVLVVDDNFGVCETTVEILRLGGYEAESTTSFDDGARMLGGGKFSLLLVDLGLDGQGLHLLDRVPNLPPVIMISGSGISAPQHPAISAFALKPFPPQRLLEEVARCIGR
jgi:DNA-binding NtrC family response regulator